jgi:inorganic pyrophosphatase
MTTTSNIIYFLIGLGIIAAPMFWDIKRHVWKSKPYSYRVTIVVLMIIFAVIGIYKVIDDDNTQTTLVTNSTNSAKSIGSLKDLISALKVETKHQSAKYSELLIRLDSLGILVKSNRPIITKKVFNTKIDNVKTLNQY